MSIWWEKLLFGGLGTVTCQRQPALGCVYKLVEINGQARIKLSQDVEKVTMPGNKNAYRLYSGDGHALIDLLQKDSEDSPKVLQKVLCRHPFQESKRAYVIPSRVEPLYKVCEWNFDWRQKRSLIQKNSTHLGVLEGGSLNATTANAGTNQRQGKTIPGDVEKRPQTQFESNSVQGMCQSSQNC